MMHVRDSVFCSLPIGFVLEGADKTEPIEYSFLINFRLETD